MSERVYRSDDANGMVLHVSQAPDGDYYVMIMPEGHKASDHCVRVTTSGQRYTKVMLAVAALFRAMREENVRPGPAGLTIQHADGDAPEGRR